MRKYFRLFFNYYLVVKSCWYIIMFLVIGYFALVSFDQGQDILKNLSLNGDGIVIRQTIIVYLAISWWSWQSFRAARVLLHFSYFNFWNYQPAYSLRAQVLVPRVLAMVPFLLLSFGVYKAQNGVNAFVILLMSSGIWMFIFLHFRKSIIVWIRAKKVHFHWWIPDYIPIKNGTYPAFFIWSKQRNWVVFRLLVVVIFFSLQYFFPIILPQYLGSAAIVLFAFGSWLIVAALLIFLEKFLKFPIAFSVVVCLVLFSFFNNNHQVRYIEAEQPIRPSLNNHFQHWVEDRISPNDSLDVYLVMAEGGGIRSAYWTSGILNKLFENAPEVKKNLYAFSSVSGGALGTTITASLIGETPSVMHKSTKGVLKNDFLAPVTASLTFNDMLQRFLPFPVKKFDRMRILEQSWENSWDQYKPDSSNLRWSDGFLKTFASANYPLMLLNSTHVESGLRTIICNADLSEITSTVQVKDFFNVIDKDIAISTAIGLSSRFPFLTPPALVQIENNTWGSLVDGGYYENLGVRTMMDVYERLKDISEVKGYKIRFNFIAIRNTKSSRSEKPVQGMFEVISPMITFSNIWANTGNEALLDAERTIVRDGNRLIEIHLIRDDKENIPLGWYLSKNARKNIDRQLNSLNYKALIN